MATWVCGCKGKVWHDGGWSGCHVCGNKLQRVEPEAVGLKAGDRVVDLRDGSEWPPLEERDGRLVAKCGPYGGFVLRREDGTWTENVNLFAPILDPADQRWAHGIWVPPAGHPWWTGKEPIPGNGCPSLFSGPNPMDGGKWRRVPKESDTKLHALRDSDNPPPWAGRKKRERCTACSALGEQCGPCRRSEHDAVEMQLSRPQRFAAEAKPQPRRYLDLRDGSTWWGIYDALCDYVSLAPTLDSDAEKVCEADELRRYCVPIHPAPSEADCVVGSIVAYWAIVDGERQRLNCYEMASADAALSTGFAAIGITAGTRGLTERMVAHFLAGDHLHLITCPRAELLAKLEAVERERDKRRIEGVLGYEIANGQPSAAEVAKVEAAVAHDEQARKLPCYCDGPSGFDDGLCSRHREELLAERNRADMERNAKESGGAGYWKAEYLAAFAINSSAVAKLPPMPPRGQRRVAPAVKVVCDSGEGDE